MTNRLPVSNLSLTVPSDDGQIANVDLRAGFRRDQMRRGLASRTIRERDKVLDLLELWAVGIPLTALTREQIDEWLDTRKLCPRSRSSYLSALHVFYAWCVDEGFRTDDPTSRIRRPKLPRLVPRPIEDEDLTHALRVAPPRMKAWLALAAYEGLRCKEIALLRREDIFDRREPPVLRVGEGKGGHQAILPLNPYVVSVLRMYGLPKRGYVFLNRDGRPYDPRTVSVYGSRYLHDLGIEATLHSLRHFMGTEAWALTKDLLVVQSLLRHANPATVAGYAAFDRELAAKAIARIHERTAKLYP